MFSCWFVRGARLGLAVLLSTLAVTAQAQEQPSKGVIQQDRVIAGSPKDSVEVRHLVLRGTNEEIGRMLAQIARERYEAKPQPSQDQLRTRAQRRYIEKNFPILYERMRGEAAAFGQRLEDDAWNYSGLDVTQLRAGCSVLYLPPRCTLAGTGIVSRDYDFTTGSITFGPLAPGTLHPTARPYLLELHPDRGYASVAMVAYDLLSGVLDGMNSEGLTVALLADDELASKCPMEPTGGPAVGLGVQQTLRLLLDTCATAEEAKETLLQTKQYYEAIPVHYLIADRSGKAFIWEYSQAHNKEFIIENPDRPLVTTNFSLHRHLDKDRPPSGYQMEQVCRRYCLLKEELAVHPGKMSEDFIKETHKKVDAVQPRSTTAPRPPVRTFWHALYFPEQRRVQVSFYLRDEPLADQPDKVRIVRSDYLEFRLSADDGAGAPAPSVPPVRLDETQQKVIAQLKDAGASVRIDDGRVVAVNLSTAKDPTPLLPLLHKLPDLAELSIRSPKMDDAGMALLAGLPRLTLLVISPSAVGDDGLKVLKTLPNLRRVALGRTKVTDAGLAHLGELTQLEYLGLRGDNITDAGLVHLKGLTNLTFLGLQETKVTDAGLEHLTGMTKLERLVVSKTAVTDEGVAKLRKALPQVSVEKEAAANMTQPIPPVPEQAPVPGEGTDDAARNPDGRVGFVVLVVLGVSGVLIGLKLWLTHRSATAPPIPRARLGVGLFAPGCSNPPDRSGAAPQREGPSRPRAPAARAFTPD